MSNPSNRFECRWQASGQLLAAYLLAQVFALGSLLLLSIASWCAALGIIVCLAHGAWAIPRHVVLTHRRAFCGLRHNAAGWQLWSRADGWRAVQLRPDSLALPLIIVLRFRLQGERRVRSLCVLRDALAPDVHRRLRVRLRFSRRRWAAPG
ncbi:toxin CptA [Pseudomonas sp. NFACC15-1]|uniref:protein YgfX n=1 Tax=unclassified Pseudomonas TaxID=196821 RepID=UPI0008853FAA|nr:MULTISPECIES: protein YgfX [unclassified Pseudomonas]SDA90498.1 toxin CptA [Pseudomonas sp. NFACC15-1]SDY95500.1 toxin CptA [Pseudomonas sp. NFACC14]